MVSTLSARVVIAGIFCCSIAGCSEVGEVAVCAPEERLQGRTVITPVLDCELDGQNNVVWCATFQTVWHDLRTKSNGSLRLENENDLVSKLNASPFSIEDLPSDGVVRVSGRVDDGVVDEIRSQMETLPDSDPQWIPREGDYPPGSVIFYTFLARTLQFEHPFRLFPAEEVKGLDSPVACFGVDTRAFTEDSVACEGQVRVLWHRFVPRKDDVAQSVKSEEFVLELKTTSKDDRLLVAKIATPANLNDAVTRVMHILETPNERRLNENCEPAEAYQFIEEHTDAFFGSVDKQTEDAATAELGKIISSYVDLMVGEVFKVPVVSVDIERSFPELVGQRVLSEDPDLQGIPIGVALQRILFYLDEKGAVLESKAEAGVFASPERDFEVSCPFLILMARQGTKLPYFAMWVVNEDILQKSE